MRRKLAGVVAVAVLVLSGCSSDPGGEATPTSVEQVAEELAEQAAENGVDVDVETGDDGESGVVIDSDEGKAAIGGAADVPAGFPAEIPLPDLPLMGAFESEEGSILTYTLVTQEQADAYFEQLDSEGFEVDSTIELEGQHARNYHGDSGDFQVQFALTGDDFGLLTVSAVGEVG